MVRIHERKTKRPCKNSKSISHKVRQNVCITKKNHSLTKPFLKQDLDEAVTVENGSLIIKLTPKIRPPQSEK